MPGLPKNPPLPAATRLAFDADRFASDNLFLLYNRYVWGWKENTDDLSKWDFDNQKSAFLEEIVSLAGSEEARACLEAQQIRQQNYLAALESNGWTVASLHLKTDGRFIAGLGYKGALETGITLHHLYGYPFLPGASVKGVTRAFAELETDGSNNRASLHQVFGSEHKDENKAAEQTNIMGKVRFLDAMPLAFPALDVDIMTPHFPDYYKDPDTNPPGNWQDPNPVPFLTVSAGTPFSFRLACKDAALLQQAVDWLKAALAFLGAGAKTSTGYGFFAAEEEIMARDDAYETAKPAKPKADLSTLPKLKSLGKNSTRIPAQVVGHHGRVLLVKLHAEGYDKPFELGGVGEGVLDIGDWVYVNVANMTKKKRVAQIEFNGRAD